MECRKSVEIAEVVLKHYTYYVHMVEYWWEYACGGIPDIRFRETHQKHIGFFHGIPPNIPWLSQVHLPSKLEWKKIHSQHDGIDGYWWLMII